MKLRDFVANSLPRVRGRKKKSQPQKSTVAAVKEQTESSHLKKSQPLARNTDGLPSCSKQNDGFLYPTYHRDRMSISGNESYGGSDCYATYLNTSLDETKYISTKEVSGFLTEHERNSLLIYSSDSERHHHKTMSKSRSRIRTNPWLPSPSSTPYNTLRTFSESQSNNAHNPDIFHSDKDVSMETADVSPTTPGSTDSGFKSSIASDIHIEIQPTNSKTTNRKHRREKTRSQMIGSTELAENAVFKRQNFCVRSQTTCDIDAAVQNALLGNLEKIRWRNHEDLRSPTIGDISCFEWEQDESYELFPCHDSLSRKLFSNACNLPYPVHDISFEYEDNLDIQLENLTAKRDPSNASIAELLHEDINLQESLNRNVAMVELMHENSSSKCDLGNLTIVNSNTKCDPCNVAVVELMNENSGTKCDPCNVAMVELMNENSSTKCDLGNVAIVELMNENSNIKCEFLHENVSMNRAINNKCGQSNIAMAKISREEVTKDVAVQTDFDDAEDSDWMTASSFDETSETVSESPRKMSIISDCMQESTDTGYSSLTRDGLLDFYEENELVANKENMMKGSFDAWFDNKENLGDVRASSMSYSWTEKCSDHADTGLGSGMAHSWTDKFLDPEKTVFHNPITPEILESESHVPFDMTSSMYIPSTETMSIQNPFTNRQHSPTRVVTGRKKAEQSYLPVIESSPIIKKPTEDELIVLQESHHRRNATRAVWEKRPYHSRPNILRYSKEITPDNSFSSPDSEALSSPQAASTPTEQTNKHRNKTPPPETTKHQTKPHSLEFNKSHLTTSNSRATRSKKSDSRKPRDNLDVIREYLGYASFEDFYFAKQCPPLSTGRTLNQIKTSLEEKVDKLRQEKLLVEMKISEAQEEERARRQEVAKFQQKLNEHRKHLLVQTLHDLKEKLENQSDRLQKSYSTILNLQHRFTQRNSNSALSLLKSGPM